MRRSLDRRHARATVRSAGLLLGGVVLSLGLASPVNAGDGPVDPLIFVDTDCVDGQGAIIVTLTSGSYAVTFDVDIDGVLVGDDVAAAKYTYLPYAPGDHELEIRYVKPGNIPYTYDDTWTVEDCGGAPPSTAAPTTTTAPATTAAPTTAAPTTAAPTTAAPTTAAASGAAGPTTPALPATGQASRNLALAALLLTAIGSVMLFIVRQVRRA